MGMGRQCAFESTLHLSKNASLVSSLLCFELEETLLRLETEKHNKMSFHLLLLLHDCHFSGSWFVQTNLSFCALTCSTPLCGRCGLYRFFMALKINPALQL